MPNDRDLLERVVSLESKTDVRMDRMERDIAEIKENVRQLTALANRGKGSLATFLWMGGLVAGIVGLIGAFAGFFTGVGR